MLSPSPDMPDREEKLVGGGGGGFPAAPTPTSPDAPRPACDKRGGGAPGFARDTKGGGAPAAPPVGRIPIAEIRLFITTESRAGGGGAKVGAATGATAPRVAPATSKRFFSLALAPPPPAAPFALGEVAGDGVESSGFVDLGERRPPPPPPDGEGRSDTPSLNEFCSPHSSAVSAVLSLSPTPAATLPAIVPASDAIASCGGSSA